MGDGLSREKPTASLRLATTLYPSLVMVKLRIDEEMEREDREDVLIDYKIQGDWTPCFRRHRSGGEVDFLYQFFLTFPWSR